MSDDSVFRSIVIISIALTLPIGLYFRVRSQLTKEKLSRSEEGIFIMIGLRLCGLLAWIAAAIYLIKPARDGLVFSARSRMAALARCVSRTVCGPPAVVLDLS